MPKVLNPATGSCESPTDNPKNNPGTSCASTPHPVSIISGNKHFDFVDVKAEGRSPLQFVRHYNSSPVYYYPSMFGTSGRTRNPIGQHWYHNYYYGLTVSAAEVKLTRADGQTFSYHPVSGGWQADADVNYRLTELLDASSVRTGWKVTTPEDTVETYNPIGDLLAITDRNGLSQTLAYSDGTTPTTIAAFPGLPIKVTDNYGKALNFTYDSAGRMATVSDPAGNVYRYSYDASGNLSTVTYPDDTPADLGNNPKKTYLYGEAAYVSATPGLGVSYAHSLTGIIDENGVRYATYQYDAYGKAISTEHAGGVEKYSLNYAPDGSNTAVTDPLGSIRTTHLATVLGVVRPTGSDQPGGSGCPAASSAITYDANGNVASHTDFNGHRTNYSYDLARNLETGRTEGLTAAGATTPQTRTVTTEWHPSFRLPTKITGPGLETSYSYDSKANITHKSLKDLVTNKVRDWTTTYTHSASGILLQKAEDGPRTDVSDITTYDYYPEDAACVGGHLGCRGQLKQVTNALGHITKINRYSANGLPEIVIDPNGLAMTMAYDVRQRLMSMDVGGELTVYAYDPAGLMVRVTQPDGAYLAYRYDNAHRLIEVKDQLGNTRTHSLDNMGNRIKEELYDPDGQLARSQNRVYDALSRLQNLVLPQ